jgi:hypothetical protein
MLDNSKLKDLKSMDKIFKACSFIKEFADNLKTPEATPLQIIKLYFASLKPKFSKVIEKAERGSLPFIKMAIVNSIESSNKRPSSEEFASLITALSVYL